MLDILTFGFNFIVANKIILFSASIQRRKTIAVGQKYLPRPPFFGKECNSTCQIDTCEYSLLKLTKSCTIKTRPTLNR